MSTFEEISDPFKSIMYNVDKSESETARHIFIIYTAPLIRSVHSRCSRISWSCLMVTGRNVLVFYYAFITMIYKQLCKCGCSKIED